MLREYKFRGWDATGQKGWVCGDLVHNKKVTKTGLEDRVMVGGYEVVPDSVGECTGVKCSRRTFIYEGDIISCREYLKGEMSSIQHRFVYYADGAFLAAFLEGEPRPKLLCELHLISVFGTIYEQNNKKQDTGIFAKKLHDCDLSVRSLICLKSADIETVGELCRRKKTDLLRLRNFGKRSLAEIEDFLHDNGLDFEMNI